MVAGASLKPVGGSEESSANASTWRQLTKSDEAELVREGWGTASRGWKVLVSRTPVS
jgi:hypothetical protein